ncbi:MAG: V-type ATPase subunit [Clostridia bacterium]|nr:V-type ATPase subunit [Clostridia bacterium]
MSKNPQQTAYMYASSRVRALEVGIIGKDRIEHLADAADLGELYARLEEYGVTLIRDEQGSVLTEPVLQGILSVTLQNVLESVPAPELYDFLRYPYDCHNIKAAIKCHLRGLDAAPMMIALGSADCKEVAKMPEKGDFSPLPTAMAKAAELAVQAYAKTANPRTIDVLLDKACFADMLACAKKGGEAFHVQLVRTRIDLINVMICLRLVRMQAGEQGAVLLEQAMLDGGTLEKALLMQVYGQGETALTDMLAHTSYDKFATALRESDGTSASAERLADDFFMELLRTARYTTFGASVPTAYFYAQEYAVKNIRIVIAAKSAGLKPETIRERIRTSYV